MMKVIYGRIQYPIRAGRISYRSGIAKGENPYPQDSLKWINWKEGWEQAQAKDANRDNKIFFNFQNIYIMNENAFVQHIVKNTGKSEAEAKEVISVFLENLVSSIAEIPEGGKVLFRNFGSFHKILRDQRNGRNPRTGEALVIPAQRVIRFKPAKNFQEAVNR